MEREHSALMDVRLWNAANGKGYELQKVCWPRYGKGELWKQLCDVCVVLTRDDVK